MNLKSFYKKNQRIISIILFIIIVFLFIGGMIITIFAGGELSNVNQKDETVKGMIKITKSSYQTSYYEGENFSFDKEKSEILLIIKKPDSEEIEKDSNLATDKYGFKINGVGEIIDDASLININKDITSIELVSKEYPFITCPIKFTLLEGERPETPKPSEDILKEILYEAEDADFYQDNVLLTNEQKMTSTTTHKSYVANESVSSEITTYNCSGKAVIRIDTAKTNICRLDFKFYSTEKTTVQLVVIPCERKNSKPDEGLATNQKFSYYYTSKINGSDISGLKDQTIDNNGESYFKPYPLKAVTISLEKGLNTISIQTITGKTPCNLDAIKIIATDSILSRAE